jgi:hypothetical protein
MSNINSPEFVFGVPGLRKGVSGKSFADYQFIERENNPTGCWTKVAGIGWNVAGSY